MHDKIVDLLEKTSNINRSAYVWNAANAVMSAMQCPLILMVITRTNGMEDAGIFSIAFAVANLMLYVGLYGLRRFQASDINEEFSFGEYQGMRFLTCLIMLACVGGYCIYGNVALSYGFEKGMVVLLVCLLKVVQAYTDVIHGNMQQKGRLDVATKCSCVRYVLEVLSIIVVLVLTDNLLAACTCSVTVSVIIAGLTSVNAGRRYCDSFKPAFSWGRMKILVIEGFALFLSLFLNMYISNAPKYAIDAYLDEETQAVYNILFMPAFMVMLLANFIFNPIIKEYAELWLEGSRSSLKELTGKIKKQFLFIALLSALGIAVAATIGVPILGFIFGVDLAGHKGELCVVMIGGGALAYATFLNTVITIIREQKKMIVGYIVAAILAFVLSRILVVKYEIMGAAALYAIIMCILALTLLIIMLKKLREAVRAVR